MFEKAWDKQWDKLSASACLEVGQRLCSSHTGFVFKSFEDGCQPKNRGFLPPKWMVYNGKPY